VIDPGRLAGEISSASLIDEALIAHGRLAPMPSELSLLPVSRLSGRQVGPGTPQKKKRPWMPLPGVGALRGKSANHLHKRVASELSKGQNPPKRIRAMASFSPQRSGSLLLIFRSLRALRRRSLLALAPPLVSSVAHACRSLVVPFKFLSEFCKYSPSFHRQRRTSNPLRERTPHR
jgi:hypothetical protein